MKKKVFTTATLFLLAIGGFISSSFNRFQNVHDTIPFTGEYLFEFDVPNHGTQVFTYVFTPKTIVTKMTGSAFTTEYSQDIVSYDPTEQRCISKGSGGSKPKDGVYFVMFFKDITDSTLAIYKHECKENGLEEAKTFPFPSADVTKDHGWNVFRKVK